MHKFIRSKVYNKHIINIIFRFVSEMSFERNIETCIWPCIPQGYIYIIDLAANQAWPVVR